MALNNHDEARVREYLLGQLSEPEQEKLEERLMVEDELFDEFEVSKDLLVEEYCAGGLESAERHFFEEHFLRSVEGQQRREFVLAMNCLPASQPQTDDESDPAPAPMFRVDPPPTFFERLKTFVRTQPSVLATVTSMVLVVAVVFAVIRFRSRPAGQTFPTTLESYSLNRAEGDGPTRIKLPPNTAFLKLRLQLSKPIAPGTRFKAELDDRINTKAIDIVESDNESATVLIPADLISHRQYAVKLTVTNPDGTEQQRSYRFVVE